MRRLIRMKVFISLVAGQAILIQVVEHRSSLNIKMKTGPMLEVWNKRGRDPRTIGNRSLETIDQTVHGSLSKTCSWCYLIWFIDHGDWRFFNRFTTVSFQNKNFVLLKDYFLGWTLNYGNWNWMEPTSSIPHYQIIAKPVFFLLEVAIVIKIETQQIFQCLH